MPKFKPKNEEVTISFHRLSRIERDSEGKDVHVPITKAELTALVPQLTATKRLSLDDDTVNQRVRNRLVAIVDMVEPANDRIVHGKYKAAYWGHAYENSSKGRIPADSINLRPFYFMLYLAEDGCIYLASQYLGTFGGYTAIKNTVIDRLAGNGQIHTTSINNNGAVLANLAPKSVEITFNRLGKSITSQNTFGQAGAIVFKKQSRDDGFEGEVKQRILSHARGSDRDIKKALAELLHTNELIEINEDDVRDCKVIATVDGRSKTVHLLDEANFATRFSVSVPLDVEGHPEYEPLKKAATELLQKHVLSLKDHV